MKIYQLILQFFATPIYPDNPDKSQLASNLFLMLRIALVATLILSLLNLSIVGLWGVLFEFLLLYIANTGRIHTAAFFFTFFAWIMLMISAVDTGGLQAVGYTSGGLLSVLLAGFLLNRRHIFTFFWLTVLFGALLAFLQVNALLPSIRISDTPERRLIAYSVFLFVGAGLAYITVNTIQTSLKQTRQLLLQTKKTELSLRENETRLRILNEIAYDLSTLSDLPSTMKLVLTKLQSIMPLDAFYLALYIPETQTVSFPIMYDKNQFWDQSDGTLSQSGWVSQVLKTGQPILINRSPEEIQMLNKVNTRLGNVDYVSASILIVPLPIGHEIIGVLSVQSYIYQSYQKRHQDILVDAGYQIAIAVQNARLYEALQAELEQRRRLEAELQKYTEQLETLVDQRTNALNRAKEQLELVLNTTSNALAFANASGDVLVTNPAFQATFAVKNTKSIEFILWSLASEDQIAIVSEALLKTIHDNEIQRVEAQILTHEGQTKDIDITLMPMKMVDDDTQNGILLSGHDITDMKEIERFKSQFVADAVHDMATPLSGLTTRLYLLKQHPEKMNDHVRALENQVKHLRNLLEDLRTLSIVDRRQLELTVEKYNINQLINEVYDVYEPVAINKRLLLKTNLDSSLPDVLIDKRQLERVLVNLVANAINYTSGNKNILIETFRHTNVIVIRVIDEGMGIHKEDLPFVFDRFYRSKEARKTVSDGTGLGLTISKEIIEIHGGIISVESELGTGSKFTIQLPLPS